MNGSTSPLPKLPYEVTLDVRDGCVCLHLQRAARAVARRFDEAFRSHGVTNGQFSLLMSMHRPEPPRVGDVAEVLAMDHATVVAATKPLVRRGLIESVPDDTDGRARRLRLTDAGRSLLAETLPIWRRTHEELALDHTRVDFDELRRELAPLGDAACA